MMQHKNQAKENFEILFFFFSLLLVTFIGAYLRIKNISHHSLWFDEGYTILGALNDIIPWQDFISQTTRKNSHPPLEFIIHHFVFSKFGISDTTARIVPCFFGVIAIPLFGIFVKKISGITNGICASLLFAFAPVPVYLSLEARYYSHIIFAAILYAYITSLFLDKQSFLRSALLFLTVIYIFNVSILFLFFFPFFLLAIFLYTKMGKPFWKALLIHIMSFTVIWPLYMNYHMFNIVKGTSNTDSSVPLSLLNIIDKSFKLFQLEFYYNNSCGTPGFLLIILLFCVFIFLVIHNIKQDTWLKIIISLLICAIPAIYTFASIRGGEFSSRVSVKYVSYILPFLLVFISYSITSVVTYTTGIHYFDKFNQKIICFLRNTLSIFLVVIFIYIVFKPTLDILLGNFVKSDWKRVEREILDNKSNHKAIVCSCVELYSSVDPCQYIYLDLIPKQNSLNIDAMFCDEHDFISQIDFINKNYDVWRNDAATLYFVTQKDYILPFNEFCFKKDFGKHGSPAICVWKLKPYSFFEQTYNSILSAKDLLNILKGTEKPINLLKNSDFSNGLKYWYCWSYAKNDPTVINVVSNSVIIQNPKSLLSGIWQSVELKSGVVYRVKASVRYPGTNNVHDFYGARLSINIPNKKEKQLIWNKAYHNWLEKQMIFTNNYTGKAMLILHMGYAKNNYSGEFKSIELSIE